MRSAAPAPVRGLAWNMGGPTGPIIAVVGDRIIMRNEGGAWRSGMYLNIDDAARNANDMTRARELGGMALTAGPVEFALTRRSDDERIAQLILEALGMV